MTLLEKLVLLRFNYPYALSKYKANRGFQVFEYENFYRELVCKNINEIDIFFSGPKTNNFDTNRQIQLVGGDLVVVTDVKFNKIVGTLHIENIQKAIDDLNILGGIETKKEFLAGLSANKILEMKKEKLENNILLKCGWDYDDAGKKVLSLMNTWLKINLSKRQFKSII